MNDNLKFETTDFTTDNTVEGLPNNPSAPNSTLTAETLKQRFDYIGRYMIALGKHNALVDALSSDEAAADLGATDPDGNATTVQAELTRLQEEKAEVSGYDQSVVVVTDAEGNITDSSTPVSKLSLINNLTSDAQVQIDARPTSASLAASTGAALIGTDDGTVQGDLTDLDTRASDLREQFDATALAARAYSESDDGLFSFSIGTVQNNGANLASTTKGRSSFIALRQTPARIVMTDDTYSIWRVWTYGSRNASDGKKAIVSAVQAGTKEVIIVPREDEKYFRVVCSLAADASHTMTDDDMTAISERFRDYNITDKTLTGNGLPADASIVGEKFDATLMHRGTLTSADDLNTTSKLGVYYYTSTNAPAHAPGAAGGGHRVLVVKSVTEETYTGAWQIVIDANQEVWCRQCGVEVWSDWRKLINDADLIRNKDAAANLYAGLTMWSPAGAGKSSENPANPADMSTNSYCYTTGAVLAGFNNDVFDLVPSRYYWALCLRSQGNANVRTYLIWASTKPEVYRGYSLSGGDTVKWIRDDSSEYAKEAEELGLHTVPKSMGVINIIKRARQLTDVKWSPSADMRGRVFSSVGSIEGAKKYLQGGFKAGVEYTGFPYSGTNWIAERFCPAQFLSAVACRVSRVSTFHPTKPTVHWDNGAYFGAVCSTLASYALGLPVTNALNFYKLFGLVYKFTIPEFDADQLALGDILVAKSHVALVTDLIHDEDDHVTFVEMSEATSNGRSNYDDLYGQNGGLCKRKMYSIEAFIAKRDGFRVYSYRYADLIPYTQDPYTPVGGEGVFQPWINLPIIPETGDHCRVKTDSSDAADRTIRLVSNVFGTTDALGQSYPSPTHVYVERNGAAFDDGDHADGMYALSTQAADEEVIWNKSGSEHGRYTKVAGTQYVELVMPQGDEAAYTAKLAAYSGGAVNTFGDACEWFASDGSAIVDVPDGVTEHYSSSVDRYYIDISGGRHKFQLYRFSDEFDPVSVAYGDDLSSGGSLANGRSTLVQNLVKEQTTITVSGETRTVWKYTFDVVPPSMFSSASGVSIVLATIWWRSKAFGAFETYSSSGASAYLGHPLYYACTRTPMPDNPFDGQDDDPSNQG